MKVKQDQHSSGLTLVKEKPQEQDSREKSKEQIGRVVVDEFYNYNFKNIILSLGAQFRKS